MGESSAILNALEQRMNEAEKALREEVAKAMFAPLPWWEDIQQVNRILARPTFRERLAWRWLDLREWIARKILRVECACDVEEDWYG